MIFVIICLMCGELKAVTESDYHYNQSAVRGRAGPVWRAFLASFKPNISKKTFALGKLL